MSADVQLDVFSVQGGVGKLCVAKVSCSIVNYRRPFAKSGALLFFHMR